MAQVKEMIAELQEELGYLRAQAVLEKGRSGETEAATEAAAETAAEIKTIEEQLRQQQKTYRDPSTAKATSKMAALLVEVAQMGRLLSLPIQSTEAKQMMHGALADDGNRGQCACVSLNVTDRNHIINVTGARSVHGPRVNGQ